MEAEKEVEQSTEPAPSSSIVADGDVSHVIGSTVVVNHLDAESNEYVNTQGVRFTTQAASISASHEAGHSRLYLAHSLLLVQLHFE